MNAYYLGVLVGLSLLTTAIYGWVANIVSLAGMDVILSGMGAARIIGVVVPPIGAVLGYF